jgi:hypothetical protein
MMVAPQWRTNLLGDEESIRWDRCLDGMSEFFSLRGRCYTIGNSVSGHAGEVQPVLDLSGG